MMDIDFYIDTVCDDVSGFESGHYVFDKYLCNSNDSAVIHYIMDANTDKIIAYFSLIASALLYGDPNDLNAISAVELKMFALDKNYQGLGLSPILLEAIIKTIEHYTNNFIGADAILLYSVPVPYVIGLYESNGFQQVEGSLTAFRSEFTEGCVPMYKAL